MPMKYPGGTVRWALQVCISGRCKLGSPKAISWGYAGDEGRPNTIYILRRSREMFLQDKAEVEKWDKHGKTREIDVLKAKGIAEV